MRSIGLLTLALLLSAPASASTVPAITAFDDAFARVRDYSVTLRAHEVLGRQTQDRVYAYWFKKPHQAKTQILSGPGAGGGGVWNGGDKVSGHQGGFLSFVHLKISIHDGRAVSVRGYTIPDGLIQNQVHRYAEIRGELTQRSGPEIDGQPTEQIELKVANPQDYGGITRAVMYLSKLTRFPLRQVRYTGNEIVTDETWSNLKTNIGLTDNDFPF